MAQCRLGWAFPPFTCSSLPLPAIPLLTSRAKCRVPTGQGGAPECQWPKRVRGANTASEQPRGVPAGPLHLQPHLSPVVKDPGPAGGWASLPKMCREKVVPQLLDSGNFLFFFFFLSSLFRSKPDLAGSQAVPRSIFASSRSCCSWDSQPSPDSWASLLHAERGSLRQEGPGRLGSQQSQTGAPSSVPDSWPFQPRGGSGKLLLLLSPHPSRATIPSLSLG